MADQIEGSSSDASPNRLQFSSGASSSLHPKQQKTFLMNQLDVPQLILPQYRGQIQQVTPNLGGESSSKRVGIPPSHLHIPPISPYSQIPFNCPGNPQAGLHHFGNGSGPSHNRSLSQPSVFGLDSLPPLTPSHYRESLKLSGDVNMDGSSHSLLLPTPFSRGGSLRIGESHPPLKAHRRSNSDIPFGYTSVMQSSSSLMPLRSPGALDRSVSVGESSGSQQMQFVKREFGCAKQAEGNVEGMGERKSEGEVVEDLVSTYMNFDNMDAFNPPGVDEKPGNENQEDMESGASGTKTNGGDSSDYEATSASGSANESGSSMLRAGGSSLLERREGLKRTAGEDIVPTTRHQRSVSVDSIIGKLYFGNESPNLLPSQGINPGQLAPTNLADAANAFSLEFGSSEFTGAELKKIMANEKLSEIALSDPKRAKRILANRRSAARSKERKMRYITELEHKVQTLQTEATTLSAQLTLLQRDSVGLTNQNNELKYRLQAMQQQAQLRDALNDALNAELQRLKIVTSELAGESSKFQQLSINPMMFPLQQQPLHFNMNMEEQQQQQQQYHHHHHHHPSQQSNGSTSANDPKQ